MRYLRILAITLWGALATASLSAQEKYEMRYKDTVRTYTMFIPETVKEGSPLIVHTHGYGSKTRWREDLNEAAARRGYAVCYPDGAPDTKGKDGWFVDYPTQSNMDRHEELFFAALLDEVCGRFGLSRDNVFMAGFSNGGDLCYQLAYTDPDLFKAYASVAGLTFKYAYDNFKLTEPVSFIEIHGNDDHTSMWGGDHLNTGGWGPYIPVPLAVAALAANNRCFSMETRSFPTLSDPGRMVNVTTYSDSPSGKDVVLYEVEGGPHSWHRKDLDTGEVICEFFERAIKK